MDEIYPRINQLANEQVYRFMKENEISPLSYHFSDFFDECLDKYNIKLMEHHFSNQQIEGFPSYWESMIHVLLNKTFSGISDDKLILKNEPTYKFVKRTENTESEENRIYSNTQRFSIEFDHLSISENKDEIILFDSKYMKSISELNYKQAFYYYFLKEMYPQSTIHNGLIAPTHGAPYNKVHIDRTWIKGVSKVKGYSDGLKIVVHYLNLKTVIDFSLSNILDFKKEMRERTKSK